MKMSNRKANTWSGMRSKNKKNVGAEDSDGEHNRSVGENAKKNNDIASPKMQAIY